MITISPLQNLNVFRAVLAAVPIYTNEEMKYLQTINLSAGVSTTVVTTLTTEPYNVFLLDAEGNDISSQVNISLALAGGVYEVYIYSTDALTGVKLKILY